MKSISFNWSLNCKHHRPSKNTFIHIQWIDVRFRRIKKAAGFPKWIEIFERGKKKSNRKRTCHRRTRTSCLMNVSIKMFSNPMEPQYLMDVVSSVQFQRIDGDFLFHPTPYDRLCWWPAIDQNGIYSLEIITLRFDGTKKKQSKAKQSDSHFVCCTFDVNAATAACQCALDTNQNIAMGQFAILLLIFDVCLQCITQFSMVALVRVLPNWISNHLNLKIDAKNSF